jgi:hypothetical protein
MAIIDNREGRVAAKTLDPSAIDLSSPGTPGARQPWVAPRWERLDTPMEVTMYAGQR